MAYPKLKIKKLFPDAQIPTKSFPTDSGFDLYAYKIEKLFGSSEHDPHVYSNGTFSLAPGYRALVNTGISATVGPGYELQIRPRSGLALKSGLTVLNTPGTVDASYRGTISVILLNASNKPCTIDKGMRIAQMVVCPVILSELEEVSDLDDTERGSGGFGSTGV